MLCDCSGEDWPILLVNEPWLLKTGAKQMQRQHCAGSLPCLPPLPGLLSTSSHAWQQAGDTAALATSSLACFSPIVMALFQIQTLKRLHRLARLHQNSCWPAGV